MAYRLNKKAREPGAALRRIAQQELRAARADLMRARGRRLGEAVHSARKRFKRVRSLLQLARGAMTPSAYRHSSHAVRDLGRRLSTIRDRQIVEKAMREFKGAAKSAGSARRGKGRSTSGKKALAQRERQVRARCVAAAKRSAGLIMAANAWPIDQATWKVIERGLNRGVRRAAKAFAAAKKKASTSNLHEWRKRVKDLQHHTELLGAKNSARYKTIKKLAETLGEDHDLALLERRLRARRSGHAKRMRDQVVKQRAKLQSRARSMAKSVSR